MRLFASIIFLMCAFVGFGDSYRILCMFPFQGKSHFVMFSALCRGLAQRGHQVDMVSHFPQKKPLPNFTDIVNLDGTTKMLVGSFTIDSIQELEGSHIMYEVSVTYGNEICEILSHERMQNFIKTVQERPAYDIVLTEYFASRCFLAFGTLLNIPTVAVSSSQQGSYVDEILANPLSSSFFPNLYNKVATLKTFWERLANTIQSFVFARMFFYYTAPQTDLVRKYLNLNISDIWEVEKNISLALINTHHSMFGVRPFTSAVVEVGGLHVEADDAEMTPDLKKWLDASTKGVVYFNLGSLVKAESLPKETLLNLYASFAKIAPVRVLMKVGNKEMLPPGLPENVLTISWVPQVPVLRHPNTRLFVSHGGLMGSQEALYCGVPVIGIPLFADQPHNIDVFVQKKMGIKLDYRKLTSKELDSALSKMLKDSSYKKAAMRESALFKDRPMTAMDTAIYWIEYVIRNGPNVLKSPAVDMPWWQTNQLDICGFVLASFLILLYLLIVVIKLFFRAMGSFFSVADKSKKIQ